MANRLKASSIRIKTPVEIERMRKVCRLAAETLRRAGEMVKPGVTLDEIDRFVHDFTFDNGAYPAPLNYEGFPKSVCLSVNDVVTHGIPDGYALKEGDIVNIDVTSRLDGYHGDCSAMFRAGAVSPEAERLCKAAREAMMRGIGAVRPGAFFADVGEAIEDYCDELGYSVVRDYCGHGIGRGFHEEPLVLHYRNSQRIRMAAGMIFTVEPMVNAGGWEVRTLQDGWTTVTADGSLSAQEEHTVLITRDGYEILTVE